MIYAGTVSPFEVITDPDKGFIGFHVLPGIKFADEFLAIEWLYKHYKMTDLYVPILIEDYINNAPGGAKSMESLVALGYLEKTDLNIMASKLLVENALFLYSKKNTPSASQLAKREHQHIVALVEKLVESDPEFLVTNLVITRMYGAHATCRGTEKPATKVKSMGRWTERGYYVVDMTTIERTLPIDGQISEQIKWEYPER